MLGLQERIPYVVPWRSDETVSDQIKMQINEVDSFLFTCEDPFSLDDRLGR